MAHSINRPVIAVLMDYENEGSFSSRPHYALRLGYFDAIEKAGGVPIALPYMSGSIDAYLEMVDGVVLPGGFYPFPADYYDEKLISSEEGIHPRAEFEVGFARELLKRDVPVLGICAGMQVLAAARGLRLHRDVHKAYETSIDHLNEKPAEEYAHTVTIIAGTLLHSITGLNEMLVNTAHREGVVDTPDTKNFMINAHAPDGVVEGLELPDQRFALGVQWHPEFFLEPGSPHLALFKALIGASSGRSIPATTGQVA